jgi:NosR/NirI family transcriptional regulator, nitrous oxide reductase regulator
MFPDMPLATLKSHRPNALWKTWSNWLVAWVWLPLLCVAASWLIVPSAQASTVTRAQLQAEFGASYRVGERLTALPVWPVYHVGQTAAGYDAIFAYVFETIDIEPVAGYGGKPINILVVMNPAGKYLDVRLLSHNEPIFQEASRNKLLAEFAEQYKDLTMTHQIQVLTPKAKREFDDQKATLHGVTAGTVSAMAMDRTIMEAAAQVAFARLGDAASGKDDTAKSRQAAATVSRGADDQFERMGFNELIGARLVQSFSRTNREVQARFSGSAAEGQDAEARLQPNAWALDMMVMLPGLPHVGRNVLDAAGWREVRALREAGHGLVGVLDGSRYPLVGSQDAPAGRAARLVLVQNGKRFDVTALPYPHGLRVSGQRSGVGSHAVMRLFATAPNAGLDLAQPITLEFKLSRTAAAPAQARLEQDWTHNLTIPEAARWTPVRETPGWVKIWEQRKVDLIVLALGLVLLTAALLAQKWLSANFKRLTAYRVLYLLFTLGFVGWAAQGQLTIVNLTALAGALMEGQSPAFLLNDPMAIVLWAFVGITLLVWGRGTFCGWLCPFGAFQELLSMAAKALRLKPQQFHRKLDAALKWVKYAVLAALTVSVAVASPLTNSLVEIEPFKTSISMGFQREWPYVAWAVACLVLSVLVFRGYCRYICPLGAALAILGKLRLWQWIPRRAECGTPCQTCRHGCAYQAIAPTGKIDYDECFQCLDCVSDYQDEQRCLPLIRERKSGARKPGHGHATGSGQLGGKGNPKIIPIQPVPANV